VCHPGLPLLASVPVLAFPAFGAAAASAGGALRMRQPSRLSWRSYFPVVPDGNRKAPAGHLLRWAAYRPGPGAPHTDER
jgi:hypothetical protein